MNTQEFWHWWAIHRTTEEKQQIWIGMQALFPEIQDYESMLEWEVRIQQLFAAIQFINTRARSFYYNRYPNKKDVWEVKTFIPQEYRKFLSKSDHRVYAYDELLIRKFRKILRRLIDDIKDFLEDRDNSLSWRKELLESSSHQSVSTSSDFYNDVITEVFKKWWEARPNRVEKDVYTKIYNNLVEDIIQHNKNI